MYMYIDTEFNASDGVIAIPIVRIVQRSLTNKICCLHCDSNSASCSLEIKTDIRYARHYRQKWKMQHSQMLVLRARFTRPAYKFTNHNGNIHHIRKRRENMHEPRLSVWAWICGDWDHDSVW